jgi:phosphoglycerate dehydrogenase-like enzyme
MKRKVLFVAAKSLAPDLVQDIRSRTTSVDLTVVADTLDDILGACGGMAGLINCPRNLFGDEVLDRASATLKWVHVGGAGCEEFIFPRLVESPIILTNGKIIQGPEVADHAVTLLLALARNLQLHIRGLGPIPRPIELRGKAACVIGLGGIGLLIAERLRAFGMRVSGVTHGLAPMVSFVERVYSPEKYLDAVVEADTVLMAAPVTALTRKMMNRRAFANMKRGAYYVNVSRGATTDTEALIEALRSGHLAGAGLDVTDPEPLAADHPLRGMANVIITPHQAGLSDHNRRRGTDLIIENIERFGRGLPLINIVDKQLGF